ncbi:hypothetical protein ACF0HZ_02840 [Leuconostoc suionicum]|uniref:hypothetical protein n=1 Tax=Leuconostoc suionicum TaxID=1511761 RepID=UPI00374A6352
MLKDVLTAIFSYIGTTTDYFVVLLLLFGKYSTKQDTKLVVLGAYLGNGFTGTYFNYYCACIPASSGRIASWIVGYYSDHNRSKGVF